MSRQRSLLGPSQQVTGNVLGRAMVARGPSRPAIPFPSRWSYYTSDFSLLCVWTRSRSLADDEVPATLPASPLPGRFLGI